MNWPNAPANGLMIDMKVLILLALLMIAAADSAAEILPAGQLSAVNQSGTKLQIFQRRDGFVPYFPDASYTITIRAPESALQQGWRCCWIEAYSTQTAAALSAEYRKAVRSNPPDVLFDSARTEASIRQIAPASFTANLVLGSARYEGSHLAQLYVHLYRPTTSGESPADEDRGENIKSAFYERARYRVARNFLEEPALTVRFIYRPKDYQPSTADQIRTPPSSQLPNYAPPR